MIHAETVENPFLETIAQASMRAVATLIREHAKYAPLRDRLDLVTELLKAELVDQYDSILKDGQDVLDAHMGAAVLEATMNASCVLVAIAALDKALATP